MEAVRIEHPLEPIYAVDSRVLVLGTMPSPKSREIGFYYGHPQNRFWKVMGALFDEPEPLGIEGRAAFLYAHGIALWDVLSSCAIVGASDASIVDPVANDLSEKYGYRRFYNDGQHQSIHHEHSFALHGANSVPLHRK